MNCYLIDKNYSENFRKNSHKNNAYLQFWLFVFVKIDSQLQNKLFFSVKEYLKFFTSLRLKCFARHIPKSSTWPSFNLKFTFCLHQIESLFDNLWKLLNTKIDGTIVGRNDQETDVITEYRRNNEKNVINSMW
jgi:hypothetical protein